MQLSDRQQKRGAEHNEEGEENGGRCKCMYDIRNTNLLNFV